MEANIDTSNNAVLSITSPFLVTHERWNVDWWEPAPHPVGTTHSARCAASNVSAPAGWDFCSCWTQVMLVRDDALCMRNGCLWLGHERLWSRECAQNSYHCVRTTQPSEEAIRAGTFYWGEPIFGVCSLGDCLSDAQSWRAADYKTIAMLSNARVLDAVRQRSALPEVTLSAFSADWVPESYLAHGENCLQLWSKDRTTEVATLRHIVNVFFLGLPGVEEVAGR